MTPIPPKDVINAIESGESSVTRKLEIYEQDGETLWTPSSEELVIERLVTGSISADATRSERRTFDITLLNDDNLLRPNSKNGFWYDKVIKLYRGVSYNQVNTGPLISIIEGPGGNGAFKLQAILKAMGNARTTVNLTMTDSNLYDQSDILISYTSSDPSLKASYLKRHFDIGKSVITISVGNTPTQVPHISAGSTSGSPITWGVTPVDTDTPIAGHWVAGVAPGSVTGYRPSGITANAQAVAVWVVGGDPAIITGSIAENISGGKWLDLHLPSVNETGIKQLVSSAILWMQNYSSKNEWECQIGEFVIDGMNDQNFPNQIKVNGRDYTKRCLQSKLNRDLIFPSGTSISEIVRAEARLSGILGNMNVPEVGKFIETPLAYSANTPRWEVMEKSANGIGYQLYFNNVGELTMSPFNDPVYDPVSYTFETGLKGNLTSFDRATNDNNLFNHIVVHGPAAPNGIPYFGEALNLDSNSPTNIDEIGDRYFEYTFDTVSGNTEAKSLAATFLKVSSLETYEMNFGSMCYPWTEVNTIARIKDPRAFDWEPDKFLISSLEISLDLGPMSSSARRITHTGEPN